MCTPVRLPTRTISVASARTLPRSSRASGGAAAGAVAHGGGDRQQAFAADFHPGQAELPSLDHSVDREFRGLAARPRRVEDLAGGARDTGVVDVDRRRRGHLGAGTDLDVLL